VKKYENEEQLKDDIFDIFSKCRNESSSDRRQTYFGQICELIFKWCDIYLSFNVNNMGLEITKLTMRIIKENIIANVPKDKEGFFKYLLKSLHNAKNEYYRNNNEEKAIPIIENDNKTNSTPLDDYLMNENLQMFCNAVEAVLGRKQERSRDCYRALFTLYCNGLEELSPVLDNEILNAFQENRQLPKQYEIYMKYHPTAQKNAAEAMASKNIKEFIKELNEYIIESQ